MLEEINHKSHLNTEDPDELLSTINIEEMLKQHLDYQKLAKSNPDIILADFENIMPEMQKLMGQIALFIVKKPAHFFIADDEKDLEIKKEFLDRLWSQLDYEQVFNDLFWGPTNSDGYLQELGHEYTLRLKKLTPTFYIHSKRIDKNAKLYYGEAINTWLLGSFNASVIICVSIIEDMLRRRVGFLEPDKAQKLYKSHNKSNPACSLTDILGFAKELKIIDKETYSNINTIKSKRNDMVHDLYVITEDESHEILLSTKEIIETILTE